MVTQKRRSGCVRRFWRRCCKADGLELKDVNLLEAVEVHHPGKRWQDLPLPDQADVIRNALTPDNWLIDPHCSYMKVWDGLIAACLVFVGVVTPYEVIFIGPLEVDHSLFWINRFVDLIFIKDMVMQFFIKIEIVDYGRRGRVLIKDPAVIRWRYLTSWFLVDFVGVIQFDLLFMLVQDAAKVKNVAPIKFLRMVRLFRLMKLARILRSSRLFHRWKNYMNISFAAQKLLKLLLGLLTCSHWMACFWGLMGYSLGREVCDVDGNRIDMLAPMTENEVSWVTMLFREDRLTPDDPCNAWHVYTAALHWAVMTITSIGYGDIVPTRNAEYWACLGCMLLGGVVWATVIGGTCAVIAKGDPVQERFETNTDLLNRMMEETGTSEKMQVTYREYLREAKVHDTADHFRELARQFSPQLRGKLLMQVSRQWIEKVPYLALASERACMHLVDGLNLRFFGRREILNIDSENLCITDRGTVARDGQLVTPGGIFHVDFIVTNKNFRRLQETVTLTYALILTLHRDDFFEIIAGQPQLMAAAKRTAVMYAMTRCVKLCVEEHRRERGLAPTAPPLSFLDAFDRLQIDAAHYTYATRNEGTFQRLVRLRTEGDLDFPVSRSPSTPSQRTSHFSVPDEAFSRYQQAQRSSKSPGTSVQDGARAADTPPRHREVQAGGQPAAWKHSSAGTQDRFGTRLEVLETTVELVLEEIKKLRSEHDGLANTRRVYV